MIDHPPLSPAPKPACRGRIILYRCLSSSDTTPPAAQTRDHGNLGRPAIAAILHCRLETACPHYHLRSLRGVLESDRLADRGNASLFRTPCSTVSCARHPDEVRVHKPRRSKDRPAQYLLCVAAERCARSRIHLPSRRARQAASRRPKSAQSGLC